MAKRAERHKRSETADDRRKRIQEAAFGIVKERGYAQATTLEIATRAKVSKRELYALFDDKQAIIASCIAPSACARCRGPWTCGRCRTATV